MLTPETNRNQGLNLLGKWRNTQILTLGRGTGSKCTKMKGTICTCRFSYAFLEATPP